MISEFFYFTISNSIDNKIYFTDQNGTSFGHMSLMAKELRGCQLLLNLKYNSAVFTGDQELVK